MEKKTNAIITEVSSKNSVTNLEEWYRKAQSLKNLLNEYDELSRTEKNKVQAIYEYLVCIYNYIEMQNNIFTLTQIKRSKRALFI